jgi:hypothetical protein
VLTTAAFGAAYAYGFLAPFRTFGVKNAHELAALAFYTLTGALVAGIGGALRGVYAEVRSQHRALDRILRQREDLLRALTHDIRSPLNAIALNAGLLSRTAGEADPSAARRALLIQENVAAIDSMLRDLVEVAALESGQLALAREPVDVASLAARVRASLAGALPVERVRVEAAPGALRPVPADPRRLERAVRQQIAALDPSLAVFNTGTMQEHVAKALLLPRICAGLLVIFGAVGLTLAAVGLYGVMSYSVRRRTREFGIRMALGAAQRGVLAMVVRQGLALAGTGLALGTTVALMLSRFAASLLYGVKAGDALTFTAAPAVLLGAAAVAVVVPAWRAARVPPMTALRYE